MVHVGGTSATGHRSSGPQDSSAKANCRPILLPSHPVRRHATPTEARKKKKGRPRRQRAGRSHRALRPAGRAKCTKAPARTMAPARRTLQPVPRRPPAPHPPARCPGVKKRKRPQETLGRLHSLRNGGWSNDQTGSNARPHRKCRRVPPGRPLPWPLRFPAGLNCTGLCWAMLGWVGRSGAGLGWERQGPNLWSGLLSLCFPLFCLFGLLLFVFCLSICSFLIRTHSLAFHSFYTRNKMSCMYVLY